MFSQHKVTGFVTGKDGIPLIGVNVFEKGTVNGAITDIEGKYHIKVRPNSTLVFALIGYRTVERIVGPEAVLDVSMEEGIPLDEIVVTALGIEKEKKALTYSVSEVDADNFQKARTSNIAGSLTGKVAGVNVSSPTTGVGGSTRVVIRGNSSISGQNQPLYIVDGIPIDNTQLGSAGLWGGRDWGDGISSLNADDIESMTVLKGTTAAALYGYRSSNGVILVTTKSGTNRDGIGVEFNSQIRMENIIDLLDFQSEYGHGQRGQKPTTQEQAMAQGMSSWGSKLDGSEVIQFDGILRPYSAVRSNLDEFYRTAFSFINTLTLTGGNRNYNFRFSGSNADYNNVTPNSNLIRRNFSLKTNARFAPNLSGIMSMAYITENNLNRPRLSDSSGNANYTVWLLPRSIDLETLKGTTTKFGANFDGTELRFNSNSFVTNPWWAAYQYEAEDQKNRMLGKIELQWDMFGDFYTRGKIGLDRYHTRRRILGPPYGTAFRPTGRITETNMEVQEINSELVVGFNREFSDNFSLHLFGAGNQQKNFNEIIGTQGSEYNVPFLHSIANTANRTLIYDFEKFQVNSLLAAAEISLIQAIHFTGTVRNDWFSTLTLANEKGDNEQIYFSAGLSASLGDLIELPKNVSFLKLRGGYATGSGPGEAARPYGLTLNYGIIGQGHLGNPLGGIIGGVIPNDALVPLLNHELEAGLDIRLFGKRAEVNFTYYDKRTELDILGAAVSPTSGFSSKIVNIFYLIFT